MQDFFDSKKQVIHFLFFIYGDIIYTLRLYLLTLAMNREVA